MLGFGSARAYTCKIRPFRARPDVLVDWLLYSVPIGRPGGILTPFLDRVWDDLEEHWVLDGVGTVENTMKIYLGDIPDEPLQALVGTPDEWLNGLDYDRWVAEGYSNPNGCAHLGTVRSRFSQAQGISLTQPQSVSIMQAQIVVASSVIVGTIFVSQAQTIGASPTVDANVSQAQTITGETEVLLILRGVDGAPTYSDIQTLEVEELNGFALSQPSPTVGRINLLCAQSVYVDAAGIRLVNDLDAPGPNAVYGTDDLGVKGWLALPAGPAGTPGTRWYSGAGVPAGVTGVVGDFYLDTDTSSVYVKGGGGWGAPVASLAGMAGSPGAKWYASAGAPAGGTGVVGDFYLNSSTGQVYEKASLGWGVPALNLTGPTGATGPGGATGATGATGAQGATGPAGTPGSIWRVAGTEPDGGAGDWWLDTSTGQIYAKIGPAWTDTGLNLRGPAGATGATGATGAAGASGATGPAGTPGATGATGAAGASGATGPAGTPGATGATGATGAAGATGATGPAGAGFSDGDKGDVIVSAGASVLTIDAALISTYGRTLTVAADASAARTVLALGTLATQSGTFSGTSSGTNTGDQAFPGASNGSTTFGGFNCTGANGVYQDSALSITLPVAGTYEVWANVAVYLQFSAGSQATMTARFYNSTAGAAVGNSHRIVAAAGQANLLCYGTTGIRALIVVATATTIKLQVNRDYATTYTVSTIESDTLGATVMGYMRIA